MNKKDLKRFFLITTIFFIITIALTIGISYKYYKKLEANNNLIIASIINNIKEEYPDIKDEDIGHILNLEDLDEYPGLEHYGILIKEHNISNSNKHIMNKCLLLLVLILTTYIIINTIITFVYLYKRNKNINYITNYLKEINKHNYKIELKSLEEGDLSILKDELYKTTVMLNEQAHQSKKDKESLKNSLSDISHQLRTPLTSINLMIDNIMEGNKTKEEERKLLVNINHKIKNTSFLVESLLKLSKFDANTIEFNPNNYKINKILESVEDNLRDLLDLNDITLNITGNKKDTLYCDNKWQIEALTNIIKNCIEHSEPGNNIDISYDKSELLTKITIKDYGKGMNPKDKRHIFDRFYKGENSNPKSIGIGMSLAKMIIEHDGGTISVESKINQGTTFSIKYLIKK